MKRSSFIKTSVASLLLLVGVTSFSAVNPEPSTSKSKDEIVYVCTGKSSKRYHKYSGCKGLNNCRGDVVKVSMSRAKSMRRTPCKICY